MADLVMRKDRSLYRMEVDAEKDGGRDWDSASPLRAASYLAVILEKG